MSHTIKSCTHASEPLARSHRPFDGVVIALSAALLVIFGIVVGRVVVSAPTVEVADQLVNETASLRAEIAALNRQILKAESRVIALEEASESHRLQASQHQQRAEQLTARQQAISTELAGIVNQRDICLDEVQQYVALNQSIPAIDVLHFAEAMFETQARTYGQLTNREPARLIVPKLPRFSTAGLSTDEDSPVAAAAPIVSAQEAAPIAAVSFPALPAPGAESLSAAEVDALPVGSADQAGYVTSPVQTRRVITRPTYFARKNDSQTLTSPNRSGITFLETASSDIDSARR